ncbi:cyclin-dependent protein kinase inhibitor SMR11-like [Castanea sativa]|uniref:cyclin-dependent protein kinase inhibitor SMR11-like n=1 Tax=Castanea sativa TaxID=21020 RepID=UPI003F64F875
MDSESPPEESKKIVNSAVKSDEVCQIETRENVTEAPAVLDGTVSLGPITPDSDREIGDFPIDSNSNSNREDDPTDDSSPRTPKDGVFDPFAPGPDDKALAPLCNKYPHEPKGIVARRLDFHSSVVAVEAGDCGNGAEPLSDEVMFESVYENLLEAILSKQTEDVASEISNVYLDSDGCRTPPFAPRLTGIADTCPGPPIKPAGQSRNIDLGLCRKLEF